ncbi:MAG: DUF559 domain-containing protein [Chitinophagaceae bacterium]|nr:DUF559 domain-containing protein [Chitinophagaceae bacterium]
MHSNFHYNKSLKFFSGLLRKHLTKGERILWHEILQNKKMKGYRFLRQRPIENYIVDFFCKELLLIIELDGYSHDYKVKEDERRDSKLRSLGFTILRIPDQVLFDNIENVVRIIEIAIAKIEVQKRQ